MRRGWTADRGVPHATRGNPLLHTFPGTVTLGGLVAPPSPLPAPIATEQHPGTTMWGVTLPTLAAHTTYTVGYRFTNSYCGRSETFTTAMGTFTTQ
jgi:hypothetical protein